MKKALLTWLIFSLSFAALGCAGPGAPTSTEPVAAADALAVTASQRSDQAPALLEVPAPPATRPAKQRPLVMLDPGHGGDEIGSAHNGVVEKESNLEMALRVETLLLEMGYDVQLTRRSDARVAAQIPGFTATRSDIQARIDMANAADADVFVSIHSNGSPDSGQRGVEVWHDSSRSFAAENLRLASLLKQNVLNELREFGYPAHDRGLFDGRCFRQREDRCFSLFILGGARQTSRAEVERRGGDPAVLGFEGNEPIYSRPAQMPGALVELLIVTNMADAAVLRNEAGRQAMARGVARALAEFLSTRPAS